MDDRIELIKVGGSLLEWPELPDRLSALIQARVGTRPVLVAGGGRAADFVRALDGAHRIGEEASHALAIRSLDLTAHALAALLPGAAVGSSAAELQDIRARGQLPVLAPRRMLDEDDGPESLAHTWEVTSDSIAARLAVLLGAGSLLLLKSAAIPEDIGRAEAARLGLVDPAFVGASRRLARVGYLNLRGEGREPCPI